MELVGEVSQINANIEVLESVRTDKLSENTGDYLSLIRRGTCFLPYLANGRIAFAPSRFIGYAHNSFTKHAINDTKNGRATNSAINAILDSQPVADPTLEMEYRRFCARIEITPNDTGSFGVTRKYWVTPDIYDHLEISAEDAVKHSPDLTATEKEQIIKARIGQGDFRDALLKFWEKRCCVTGSGVIQALRASHIKPWRDSTNTERLDPYNGLLLTANIDTIFDCGLISFNDKGEIMRSSKISEEALISLGCDPMSRANLAPDHALYLAYHRNVIFLGS